MEYVDLRNLLDEVTPALVDYLQKILPALSKNWWQETVLNKLPPSKRDRVKDIPPLIIIIQLLYFVAFT